MRTTAFDFAPYRRSTVGFDRLFNLLEAGAREDDGYPPFDILREGDDSYRITLAVAGFRPEDIEVTAKSLALSAISVKKGAVINEATHVALGWLDEHVPRLRNKPLA